MPERYTVLYAHSSALVGGGNKVLLRLIADLNRDRFSPVSVIPTAGPIELDLHKLGVPYCIVDLRSNRQSRPAQAMSVLRLARWSVMWRPHLVHANELPYRSLAIGAWSARRVCHIHHPGSTAAGLRWMFRRPPHLIITPTQFVKEEVDACLRQCGLRVRVEVVLNPIDLGRFHPLSDRSAVRQRLGMDADGHHVSIVGALAPHKGHACFLRMAKEVLYRLPRTTFHIVGGDMGRGDEHGSSLRRLADELDISRHVRFWGFVDDANARDIMAASDLFVLPSAREGFGLVLAEAQACGVPVLATNVRPLDEVVAAGRTGFLLPRDEHEAFAAQAVELLANPEACRAIGLAGRQWVQERFSSEAHARRTTDLYEQVLSA